MPLLEAKGLEKWYGRRKVVDGVKFHVNEGEIVGLLGPNGAGKTTSFRMTTGQITPQGGQVWFNNADVTQLPMYRRARLGMGYLSQETSVFRKLTVEQNILAILEAMPVCRTLKRSLSRRERWERTDAVLHQFGLEHVRKNYAARLSGGEKRRLEIARCLVCEPLLILLDEPFTGIDPKTIADIQDIVRKLRDESKIGILLTDHNVRETLKITDRSYLIKDGTVRTHGAPQELIHDPIAINEYLGKTFNDDAFGESKPRQPNPPQPVESVQFILEREKIHRLVEELKTERRGAAAGELLARGQVVVPALLEALERRDVEMRSHAFAILDQLMQGNIAFDPYAPEEQRRQQLAGLRQHLDKLAG
jgi:lipopolysaccharide export system ATP-binding protein